MAATTARTGAASESADVDDYLAAVPKEARATLQKLRKVIQAAAPQTAEVVSYRIPVYKHYGMLVGFAAFKKHCSLFVMSLAVAEAHQHELEPYDHAKGTIHFTPAKPLPAALVRKIVRARIKENESRWKKKKEKTYGRKRK